MNVKKLLLLTITLPIFQVHASALEKSANIDTSEQEQRVNFHEDEDDNYTVKCKKVNDALAYHCGDQSYQQRSHIMHTALQNGISPNDLHYHGTPILQDAVIFSDLPTTQLLLDQKADPNFRSQQTLVMIAPITIKEDI